ncbi:MAG: DUF1127 domain-containing protein [Granulosicoccus sp.]|nr:DUF1127 domain-containing protein [Granulosicoccus sp.]
MHTSTNIDQNPAQQLDQNFLASLFRSMGQQLKTIGNYMMECERIRNERAQLAQLDDEILQDIGISRAGARLESSRKFTDIPTR